MLFFLLIGAMVRASDAPFHRGVNLTNWLQTPNPRQIQFTKFTRQDLVNIKSLGCDVIRLPINLHFMTGGAPAYAIDPLFFSFLDPIVGWAEELGIHLILDDHTSSSDTATDPAVGDILVPVWTQMAGRYKNRSVYVYYEVLNEPHGIADKKWNEIQQKVISAIRAVDSKHTIVIGPAGWNGYNNLAFMPAYTDTNLIYTFHFYDPFLFTHQGAGWANPPLTPLFGVPFPYDAARMPACPPGLKGTWVEQSLASGYSKEGTVKRIREWIDTAASFKNQRGVPVYCGEFGVYIPNSPAADRVEWYRAVRTVLEEKGIAWTIWDYTAGFGLFNPGTAEMFNHNLNVPLVQALGLNVPEQKPFVLKPDSTGFDLYTDCIGPSVREAGWAGGGTIDYYSETGPASGKYCMSWTGVDRYAYIGFAFRPVKDLSELVRNGYAVDFWVRGDSPEARFDLRFVDTKTADPDDHPWRMRMPIDQKWVVWDGQWKHLQIPLKSFTEHGSWDNGWFNPKGLFDWRAVDRFEIVAEYQNLKSIRFWFDNISVVDPLAAAVIPPPFPPPRLSDLEQNYPNPFNPSTEIRYQLGKGGTVEVTVYDVAGRKVRTLVDLEQPPGAYAVTWDGRTDNGSRTSAGMYFCRMKAPDIIRTVKMILMP